VKKRKTHATLAALAAVAALTGCGSLAMQEDAPARIEAALQAYSRSLAARDAGRAAAAFTPDAELQNPGGVSLKTPEDIRKFFDEFLGANAFEAEMKGVSLQVVGPSALQTGTFRFRSARPEMKVAAEGTFEAEWERQPDGSWLLARLQTNPPPFKPNEAGAVP
jgi:uncharacterized protein (TIGR02246 family)